MARFFIDRPVFAWVLAILVMLGGVLAIKTLPIAQYPTIAPPAISITATYPGASAQTVQDTVTQVIEQRMKGLDRLSYIASTSDATGAVTITLTFENGTNPDTAQVQVQNKLSLATPLLPQEVQSQGLQVTKSTTNFLVVLAFLSTDGKLNASDLADYVAANVQEPLSRVSGVGDTQLFGSQYAMRIWLDPSKLYSYQLTASDIKNSIQSKNVQISAGELGGLPAVNGQRLDATITAQTRLKTAAQFEDVVVKTQSDGALVRLRDVARIELGNESYNATARYNGKPAAGLAIKLATGANALDTVKGVEARLAELSKFFPEGVKAELPYDTTPFVRISIEEVTKTLVEAIVLVFLVMYLFLQNFRATLIPTIAVPVVLLGTFAVLSVAGFTINTLTMLAMVLAIGLLVDDAIVVVENVERVMAEEGLSPKEATKKSMEQITGALVGVAMVLAAVFVPMAFFPGSTGVIYRQFSITIVSAMALSVATALILTPALCATLLKPKQEGHEAKNTGFFGWFNRSFETAQKRYHGALVTIARRSGRFMIVYAVIAVAMLFGFIKIPGGFLPDEDQGILYAVVQLPPGSTQAQTMTVLEQMEQHFLKDEKDTVASLFTVAGFSFAGNGQASGFAFVKLKPWDQRTDDGRAVTDVAARAAKAFQNIRGAQVFAFAPPAVSELGNATGFDLMLQDRANLGHEALTAARNQLLGTAGKNDGIVALRPNGQDDTPQFVIDIDEAKAGSLGVSLADINDDFATAFGSIYVNDFLDRGRTKKVFLQGDAPFRMAPADIDRWYVRSSTANGGSTSTMVPFSSFSSTHWTKASPRLERYNGVPSMEILGMAKPGTLSSGQALDAMEQYVAKLPAGIGYEWTGISLQEKQAGSQVALLYALSLLIVFLSLAALYESWSIPVAVLLVVPLGIIGTVIAAILRFHLNDVYFQVGLLTTIGLASKNAILIVEFAKDLHAKGKGLVESALEAARLRLRPILMTSLAFILGVLPMAMGSGAGAGARNALGSAVIGGMVSATVLAIFFVPLFFIVVLGLFTERKRDRRAPHEDQPVPVES